LPISWELLSLEHLVECSRTRIRTTIGGAKASQILQTVGASTATKLPALWPKSNT
jgi:hypothetical protein